MTVSRIPNVDRIYKCLPAPSVVLTEFRLYQISDSEKEKVRYALKEILPTYGEIRCILYLLEGFECWEYEPMRSRVQSVVALLNAIYNQEGSMGITFEEESLNLLKVLEE